MPYRFEAASTGRAGCSNKECKDNKVKIAKGELRVGSWVENEKFQSWTWRHWGCTTPKVLENIKSAWEEMQGDSDEKDYSNLDGYDELSEEYQVKVRNALEQGHVDSEDWKGDAEMNTPGSMGFRVRKKKADQAKKNDDESAKAADSPEAKPKARKTRAKPRVIAESSSGSEEEKPIKKKAPRAKKAASDDASDADAEVKSKKRGRPAKAISTEKVTRANTGSKRKAINDEDAEAAEDKPKRRGRSVKTQETQAEDGDAVPEKPKRGRKKAEKKSEDN